MIFMGSFSLIFPLWRLLHSSDQFQDLGGQNAEVDWGNSKKFGAQVVTELLDLYFISLKFTLLCQQNGRVQELLYSVSV